MLARVQLYANCIGNFGIYEKVNLWNGTIIHDTSDPYLPH